MPLDTTLIAVALGKLAGQLSRRLGAGGGTTLPGTLARRVAPSILRDLSARLPHGALLVSGTNGKTTTSRMVSEILRAHGEQVLHNRAGANLIGGLTTTVISATNWLGQPQATIGLFETDEAALPQAIAEVCPRLVLIHNLFRDQLDRYGEVDTVAAHWRTALATLPASSTLVLNADDPAVADLGRDMAARVVYYGLEDTRHATGAAAHIADSQFCRRCGTRYHFSAAFYAHIGHYQCPQCGHQRPQPEVSLARLDLRGTTGSTLGITYPGGAVEIVLPLPGLYNALNALAATAVAYSLAVSPVQTRRAIESFSAAFGRIERVAAGTGGPTMLIALIKNPVGASETVRMLVEQAPGGRDLHVLIAINDRFADGTDVSWLWDADFEALADAAHITVSGTRAADMAVRLKYAGLNPERMTTIDDLPAALDTALARLPAGATLYLLPTYTAMLDLREDLAKRGWVRQFWEE